MFCPFEGEVWGIMSVLGTPGLCDKHYDKVFAFDSIDDNSYSSEKLKEYLVVAQERNIPVVGTRKYATERYPLVQMFEEFGVPWFRPTISYMLALAIYKKYDLIKIYGIDQDKEDRYILSRPFVDFWLGVAVGRKQRYTIANKSFPQYPPDTMQKIIDRASSPKMGKKIVQSDGLTGSEDIFSVSNL